MGSSKNKNKTITWALAGLFVLTGTYNAVVINSQSEMSNTEMKFVKRLDEVFGVTISGRTVATSVKWEKLAQNQIIAKAQVSSVTSVPVESIPAAAVQEELTLSLVEVINQKKWQSGLPAAQFNGSLTTNNGVIENLAVSLPNGEGMTVSFSEMTGNVFEYDLNGEVFAGIMYQVDNNAYMVTLTNGPLEGTRLRFSSQSPAEEQIQTQQVLAESNIEVGSFGSESEIQGEEIVSEQMVQNDKIQGFNLDQTQAL